MTRALGPCNDYNIYNIIGTVHALQIKFYYRLSDVDTILPTMEPGNPHRSAWTTAKMCRNGPTTLAAQNPNKSDSSFAKKIAL